MLPFVPAGAHRILDVGCGAGAFGAQLQREFPGTELWAVEQDIGGADHATRSGVYEKVLIGDFLSVIPQLPRHYFDCIFFNDVLEHVVEPESALRETKILLCEHGSVVASIPNVRCIDVVKPLIFAGEWHYEDYGLLDRTHLRFFTRKSMLRMFDETGYDVRLAQGIHARNTWKVRLARWMFRCRLDDFLYQQYVIVAQVQR